MITLTRLNGICFTLNADLIETVEETPDTVILLNNGKTYMVKESLKEVLKKILRYKRNIFANRRPFKKAF
jgi:flagellar protein FlbD